MVFCQITQLSELFLDEVASIIMRERMTTLYVHIFGSVQYTIVLVIINIVAIYDQASSYISHQTNVV